MAQLVHELAEEGGTRLPTATALRGGTDRTSYAALATTVAAFGAALRACGHRGDERVAVRLPASSQAAAVAALLGTGSAGCAFVAIDPALDAQACAALLRDCGARVLVAAADDAATLSQLARRCPALRTLVVHGDLGPRTQTATAPLRTLAWNDFLSLSAPAASPRPCSSLGALVYDTACTGVPRAMALSHRNLVADAAATARCLGMVPGDRLYCTLPIHHDYGLNALLATLAAGATAVLSTPVEPAKEAADDLARMLERGELTGLMSTPALLSDLVAREPRGAAPCLRFLGCVGGVEAATLDALRRLLPRTRIHLFHDIGDARRATSLTSPQGGEHPGSVGCALPYTDWELVHPDGRACAAGETGELVRRGALVPAGYWNDVRRSGERLRLLAAPGGLAGREPGHWTGVTGRKDPDGFLYPAAARGDIILTGGYRVSSQEVERVVNGTGLVLEAAAVGVAHPLLGQVIAVLATPRPGARLDSAILLGACRARLPRHMLPAMVDVRRRPLPRGGDGQIDRALLAGELAPLFAEVAP